MLSGLFGKNPKGIRNFHERKVDNIGNNREKRCLPGLLWNYSKLHSSISVIHKKTKTVKLWDFTRKNSKVSVISTKNRLYSQVKYVVGLNGVDFYSIHYLGDFRSSLSAVSLSL